MHSDMLKRSVRVFLFAECFRISNRETHAHLNNILVRHYNNTNIQNMLFSELPYDSALRELVHVSTTHTYSSSPGLSSVELTESRHVPPAQAMDEEVRSHALISWARKHFLISWMCTHATHMHCPPRILPRTALLHCCTCDLCVALRMHAYNAVCACVRIMHP